MRNVLFAIAVIGLIPSTVAAPPAAVATWSAPPANGEMGFIVTHFGLTFADGKDDCPDGIVGNLRDNLLETLPEAERQRLKQPEHGDELQSRIEDYASGPDGSDICTNVDRFTRPVLRTVRSAIVAGFNLDDDTTGKAMATGGQRTCAHSEFSSPSGETGVDNQAWRALGCITRYRGVNGRIPDQAELLDGSLANGEHAQLILLRGVDSLVRDDDVEIIYANSADRAIRDGRGNFISGASYAISDTMPRTPPRNVMRGRIANGVLEAETPRLLLKLALPGQSNVLRGARAQWEFTRVKLRLAFQQDGSIKGLLGGYQPFDKLVLGPSLGGRIAATIGLWDCAAIYATLKANADGDADPATGRCTTISSSYEVNAVRAFVIDPKQRTSQPRQGRPASHGVTF